MTRLLRYWLNRIVFKDRADYLSMGLGIEARAGRAADFWGRHLELTKEFCRKAARELGPLSSIYVFGAGRLLDVDLGFLLQAADRVTLFDADPGVLPFWRAEARRLDALQRIDFRITDISGVIDEWTSAVKESIREDRSGKRLERLLRDLKAPARLELPPADLILSVNMLSQVSIYFRDRVLDICRSAAGIESDEEGCLPGELQSALTQALKSIQEGHLNIVGAASIQGAAVIADDCFYYYKKDSAQWQEEPALLTQLPDNLGRKQVKEVDSWLWHIAPQGIENPDYGSIHKVRAVYYSL